MKTQEYRESAQALLGQARKDLLEDMHDKGIGAIVWDNATAGFHFIPEVVARTDDEAKARVYRITGLYAYDGELYLIEEDRAGVDIGKLYDRDTEVRPTVVTLSPDAARRLLGDPTSRRGYTTQASMQEWLSVADCYFEALNEK